MKIIGVHPIEGHDIPGVRSIQQLQMTEHYKPDEYDEHVEVNNQECFDLCTKIN